MKFIKEFQENIDYKISEDEERIKLSAYLNKEKIGEVVCELLFGYGFEFEDVFTEDEFDKIFSDDNIIKIEHIEIKDDYKGQGYAKNLMKKIIRIMKNRGYTQFYLNASPMGFSGLQIKDLIEFYKSLGFKEILNQGHNSLMVLNYGKN